MPIVGGEAVALAKRGKQVWNEWASSRLAAKRELVARGIWETSPGWRGGVPEGANEPTRTWLESAAVDFQSERLERLDFSEFVFPGVTTFGGAAQYITDFSGAEFNELVNFRGVNFDRTKFAGTIFRGRADFDETIFANDVDFSGSRFEIEGDFRRASFRGTASFWRCEARSLLFTGASFQYLNFEWCEIEELASFEDATFNDYVKFRTTFLERGIFDEAKFKEDANFRHVTAQYLSFERAIFSAAVDLTHLHVWRNASFRSLTVEGELNISNSRFGCPPDFTLSTFRREPRVDSCHVSSTLPGFYARPPTGFDLTEGPTPFLGFWMDEDAPAKFRELRKIAAASGDMAKELDFHAQEIRSSRFVTDWPFPWRGKSMRGIARFWFGLAYGTFSDFGRSVVRPLAWLVVLLACSVILFLAASPYHGHRQPVLKAKYGTKLSLAMAAYEAFLEGRPCEAGLPETVRSTTNAPIEALNLAAMNALIFADTGSEGARRAYGCLYGMESDSVSAAPIVSPYVNWISRVQRVLSAALIFLFGLGLRNTLKMK